VRLEEFVVGVGVMTTNAGDDGDRGVEVMCEIRRLIPDPQELTNNTTECSIIADLMTSTLEVSLLRRGKFTSTLNAT